ncbi:MAG: hypothetical protein IKL10_04875 [Clostridia bacterium]|nr:hypothetical protein [Clostridia bacterium]
MNSNENLQKLEDSTVTVRIDCRNCTAKRLNCHLKCPQVAAVQSDGGKEVTKELLQKGRRAYKHKDIDVSFTQYMTLIGEKEQEV